jgi:hypothetical protein
MPDDFLTQTSTCTDSGVATGGGFHVDAVDPNGRVDTNPKFSVTEGFPSNGPTNPTTWKVTIVAGDGDDTFTLTTYVDCIS